MADRLATFLCVVVVAIATTIVWGKWISPCFEKPTETTSSTPKPTGDVFPNVVGDAVKQN